jgi:hypothetical protein
MTVWPRSISTPSSGKQLPSTCLVDLYARTRASFTLGRWRGMVAAWQGLLRPSGRHAAARDSGRRQISISPCRYT